MADPINDRKRKEEDLALKRHNYAVQIFQNEIGRVWQRTLVFWGFVAASFVAYGNFVEKEKIVALAIACFGLICSVCWTLVNRASTWSQSYWVDRVDRLERKALKIPILREGIPKTASKRWWSGWRYSSTKLMIALSDLTAIVWFALVVKSSLPFLQMAPQKWNGVVVIMLLGTVAYIVIVIFHTRSDLPESTPPMSDDPPQQT